MLLFTLLFFTSFIGHALYPKATLAALFLVLVDLMSWTAVPASFGLPMPAFTDLPDLAKYVIAGLVAGCICAELFFDRVFPNSIDEG